MRPRLRHSCLGHPQTRFDDEVEACFEAVMMRLGRLFTPEIRPQNLREITSIEECETAFAQELAVIFKHSTSCDRSHTAYRTVTRFCSAEPARTIFLISVPKFRDAAAFVENHTGIRHESPQVLALRNGVVFAYASHGRINAAFLGTLYTE